MPLNNSHSLRKRLFTQMPCKHLFKQTQKCTQKHTNTYSPVVHTCKAVRTCIYFIQQCRYKSVVSLKCTHILKVCCRRKDLCLHWAVQTSIQSLGEGVADRKQLIDCWAVFSYETGSCWLYNLGRDGGRPSQTSDLTSTTTSQSKQRWSRVFKLNVTDAFTFDRARLAVSPCFQLCPRPETETHSYQTSGPSIITCKLWWL